MHNKIQNIKKRIIFGLLILIGLIFAIISQVDAKGGDYLDSKTYKESGTAYDYVTEYDFALKAASQKKWYGLTPSKLIGNYMHMNYGDWPNISTIYMKHAFCLGHGNTSATAVQDSYWGLYKVENIWDIDMDSSDPPGTSIAYNVEDSNEEFAISSSVGKILAKWSFLALQTHTSTLGEPKYNGYAYNGYINQNKKTLQDNSALSKKIGISNYSFVENDAMQNYANKLKNYKFKKGSASKTAEAKEATVSGTTYTYAGPYTIESSFVSGEDYISGITAKAGSTTYKVSGWATKVGGDIHDSYTNFSNPSKGYQKDFYIVIKGSVPADTILTMTINKKFSVIKSRTMFLRNSSAVSGAQNIIIYRADPETRVYPLELKVTTTNSPGKLKIVKADSSTGSVLKGAEFKVKLDGGKYIKASGSNGVYTYTNDASSASDATVLKTSSSGTIEVSNLKEGTYLLYETKAPAGYVMASDNPKEIWVNSDSRLKKLYNNYLEYALKCFCDNCKDTATPTFIKVYNQVLGKNNKTDDIMPKGSAARKKLNSEKSSSNFDKMTDAKKRLFYLHYVVTNYSNVKLGYSGLTSLTLRDINGTGETNANKKKYLQLACKKIAGTSLTEAQLTVYCARSKGYSSTIYYNKQTGRLRVYKADEDNKKVKLSGAKFAIKDSNGNVVHATESSTSGVYNYASSGNTQFVTNDSGFFEVRGLTPGKYTVTETQAPAGYTFDSDDSTFTITVQPLNKYTDKELLKNQLKTMFSGNDRQKKYKDEDDAVTSAILLKDMSLNSKKTDESDIVDYVFDGFNKIKIKIELSNTKIVELTLDEIVAIITKIRSGTATEAEKEPLRQYLAQAFNAYTGSSRTIDHVNNHSYYARAIGYTSRAIYNNNKVQGRLRVFKTDKNNNTVKLKGAVFTVKDPNGKTVYGKETSSGSGVYNYTTSGNSQFVTNSGGYFEIRDLTPGIYTVTETKAPEGYEFDSKSSSYTVNVLAIGHYTSEDALKIQFKTMFSGNNRQSKYKDEDDAVASSLLLGSVSINSGKTDVRDMVDYVFAKYSTTQIPIKLSSGSTVKKTFKQLEELIEKIHSGKATDSEKEPLRQYLAQVFNTYTGGSRTIDYVHNAAYYSRAIGYHNAKVILNSKSKPDYGDLIIYKTDVDTQQKGLSGAKFKITNKGNIVTAKEISSGVYDALQTGGVSEFVTGNQGTIEIRNLDVTGSYVAQEIEAPVGYAIKTNPNLSVNVSKKDKYDQGEELNYLVDALSRMFYNLPGSIDTSKLIDAIQIGSTNSYMNSYLTNHVIGKKTLTSYRDIRNAVEIVLINITTPIKMNYNGTNTIVYKKHQNNQYSLLDAIQAVRNNKTVGKLTSTTAPNLLMQYIVQVYNAYTGYARTQANKYNLQYYNLAIGNSAAVFADEDDGTTWLKLKKIDSETKKGINGITFIIKRKRDGKYLNGVYGYSTSESTAKPFVTENDGGEDGIIKIKDLDAGVYIIIEKDTGDTGYLLPDETEHEITIVKNKTNEIEIENSKITNEVPEINKELKISGKVWVDTPTFDENKNENTRDDKYDSNTDTGLDDIIVELKDSSNKTISTTTTGDGGLYSMDADLTELIKKVENTKEVVEYKNKIQRLKIKSTAEIDAKIKSITNSLSALGYAISLAERSGASEAQIQGMKNSLENMKKQLEELQKEKENLLKPYNELCDKYKEAYEKAYKELLPEFLAKHYISFSYDGITYTNVIRSTDSLAEEKADERKNFNKDFEVITGEDQVIRNQTVKYDTSDSNHIRITNNYLINAITDNTCLKNRFNELSNTSNDVTEITEINLGVYERIMPELALDKDVYKAEISMNSKKYTYRYDKKNNADIAEDTTVGVVFEKNIQLDEFGIYKTPLYRADITNTNSDEYSFKVMYKIGIVNNSAKLYNKVSVLEEYFSTSYEYEGVYNVDSEGNETKIDGITKSSEEIIENNKHIRLTGFNISVSPNETKYVYIKFNLPLEKLKDIYNNLDDETHSNLYNTAEISSYSTYSDSNYQNPYAGFDSNSIPNNYYREYDEYEPMEENDTNIAPGLKLVEDVERSMKGIVFKDNALDDKVANGEQIGNGYYDEGEETIEGVTVSITNTGTGETKSVQTDNDGRYEIPDVAPGTYKVVFTWGDEKYNPTKYKSTIISNNYSITDGKQYSGAIDNYATRMDIDKNSEITYEDMIGNPEPEVKQMTSETINDVIVDRSIEANGMSYSVDEHGYRTYYYNIEGINLGIIERPKQSMQITKDLSYIKITAADGQTIAESEIENGAFKNSDINYTVYLPKSSSNQYGAVKTEIDNTYLPVTVDATYTLSVKNTSQKDYYRDSELSNYYKFGTVDATNDKAVKLKPTGVYDYINNAFSIKDVKQDDIEKTYEIITSEQYTNEKQTEPTVIEEGYNRLVTYLSDNGKKIEEYSWATDLVQIKEIFEQWILNQKITGSVQTKKLDANKIIELNSILDKDLAAGETNTAKVDATATVASSAEEITLQNDAEIAKVEKSQEYGSTSFKTYTTLYDRGEKIIITPPTGENKDNTNIIIITALAVIAIVILGVGIIFIKKKVLNSK